MRLGYACINLTVPTQLRTTRLRNATPERVLELARHNLHETVKAARWNAEHGIGLLRLTSDMIPFAAHPDVRVDWREALKEDLAQAGEAIRAAGQRASTHPGQYSVLNSPRPEVVAMARLDLA
ncbi:MAG TPA: UV DNA damage repair endonuclease UvsE, partial [Candidatus Thermoplasmatota archaeon]|nr:UV DNA damage repair endonuclease UvsE [Candidatus Thermoplasmatota archaeon]